MTCNIFGGWWHWLLKKALKIMLDNALNEYESGQTSRINELDKELSILGLEEISISEVWLS
ncbi:MAG: hypothetical protein HC880_09550 [Bacteroidia bacterium]|nr:hypothetical protein [Bacteroidia bacterium]